MNEFVRFTADNYGIALTSSPISIYLSWAMVAGLAALAIAPRIVRTIRKAISTRKAQAFSAPAIVTEPDSPYTW